VKTKFSAICEQVAAKGVPVVVTRRGKPLVRIEAIRGALAKPKGVWDRRAEYLKASGPLEEDFVLPAREKQTWRDLLDD
jgi:antitoxin (DNA-binding transcriptional repressor) of toxin-antitoxin stability system